MNEQRFNYTKSENRSDYSGEEWKMIDWEKAEEYINRLQLRIVKAVEKGKWNLVKRLQYLLTNSFYAKAMAGKKVIREEKRLGLTKFYGQQIDKGIKQL